MFKGENPLKFQVPRENFPCDHKKGSIHAAAVAPGDVICFPSEMHRAASSDPETQFYQC